MASPQIEVFALFGASGAPLTGATPTFETYKDTSGVNQTTPSITEIGGGLYSFVVTFADPTKGIVYVINGGAAANNQRVWRFVRPEDWNTDQIPDTRDAVLGSWRMYKTGPKANQMEIYRVDGTLLATYNLYDDTGAANTTRVFWRSKV